MSVVNQPQAAKTAGAGNDPDAITRSSPRWRGAYDYLPVLVGAVIVVSLSLAWLQVLHPYLEHDDWDSLLPVTHARLKLIHGRLLNEGRWLNYAWWRGPGRSFSTVGASLLYIGAYLAFVGRLAQRWAPGWLGLPVVVALFASPMPGSASFWPSTLGPSMVIAAAAAFSLPWCAARNRTLAPWIFVAVLLSFLAYPPVTLVLLVVLVVELVDDSWKRLIGAVVLFGVSYLVASLAVFALNEHAFGKFGIEVRPWRHPNAVHNLHDLWINIKRFLVQMELLVQAITLPVVLGLCALAGCVAVPALRRRAVRLMLAFVVVAGLAASPTIVDGVVTPFRGSWWAWLFPIVPTVWLVREQAYPWLQNRSIPWPRIVRTVAVLALVATGLSGINYWRDAIHYNQHRLALYSAVERQLGEARKQNPSDRVLIYGDAADWKKDVFTQEAQYLSVRATYMYGIVVTNCRPPACNVGQRPAVVAQLQQGAQVVRTDGFILVVPPSHVHPHPSYG